MAYHILNVSFELLPVLTGLFDIVILLTSAFYLSIKEFELSENLRIV